MSRAASPLATLILIPIFVSLFSSQSQHPDALEYDLRDIIHKLQEDSSEVLSWTEGILRSHRTLASIMITSLEEARETGELEYDEEIKTLAQNIEKHSASVIEKVEVMRGDVDTLIDKVQSSVIRPREKSFGERVWSWIKRAVYSIGCVVGGFAGVISTLLRPFWSPGSDLMFRVSSVAFSAAQATPAGKNSLYS